MQAYSPSDSQARCETFNLAAALDAYELTCSRLVANWLDMGEYADAGRALVSIRDYGVSNPPLAVLSLQLAIAHAELESALWQKSSVGMSEANLQEVKDRHEKCILALRRGAHQLLRAE